MHTVIGHEIGHFYQQTYFLEILAQDWEARTVNELLPTLSTRYQTLDEQLLQAQEILKIYRGMVREILPDVIGYLLFGPSILFAHYCFSSWMNDKIPPSVQSNYYPPLKMRMRILYENYFQKDVLAIKKSRGGIFKKTILNLDTNLDKYLQIQDDISLLNSNFHSAEALKIFNRTLQDIIKFCKSKIDKNIYKFNPRIINELINRIDDNIPPNEIQAKPIKLGDIFLSGWIYYFHSLDDEIFSNGDNYIIRYDIISKLLLKASNLAFIHTLYKERSGGNIK